MELPEGSPRRDMAIRALIVAVLVALIGAGIQVAQVLGDSAIWEVSPLGLVSAVMSGLFFVLAAGLALRAGVTRLALIAGAGAVVMAAVIATVVAG